MRINSRQNIIEFSPLGNDSYFYEISIDELQTLEDRQRWTKILSEKNWFENIKEQWVKTLNKIASASI